MSPFSLFADEPLKVGDKAPEVTVVTHLGESLDMADLYAKGPVAVFFYPRSFTGGCTKQVCNVRDNYDDLRKAGVTVVGVSTDSVDKQKAFTEEYALPFILVADEEKVLGKAFQVDGFLGMAYKRQTFLVVDGKVAWRDLSAKPTSQSEDILLALKSDAAE
ncbi:MAG: peroxiredoxin [Puniceicoccaceae bacterium]